MSVPGREAASQQAKPGRNNKDEPATSATVQVVDQALAVLREICAQTEPYGVRELSRRLLISKSTVQRILASLEQADLVVFDDTSRKYGVGPGVLTLAWRYAAHSNLVSVSADIADELAAGTGETVSVSTIVGNNRVTVYEAESNLPLRLTTGVGRPHSLFAGATSRVLLGLLPEEERSALLVAAMTEQEERAEPADRAVLEKRVQEAISCGHAVSRGEWIDGAVGVAVPIGRVGRMVATLSIYSPQTRMTDERIAEVLPALRERAHSISAAWRTAQ